MFDSKTWGINSAALSKMIIDGSTSGFRAMCSLGLRLTNTNIFLGKSVNTKPISLLSQSYKIIQGNLSALKHS